MTKKHTIAAVHSGGCYLYVPEGFKSEMLTEIEFDEVPVILKFWKVKPSLNQNPKTAIYSVMFDPRQSQDVAVMAIDTALERYFALDRPDAAWTAAQESSRSACHYMTEKLSGAVADVWSEDRAVRLNPSFENLKRRTEDADQSKATGGVVKPGFYRVQDTATPDDNDLKRLEREMKEASDTPLGSENSQR